MKLYTKLYRRQKVLQIAMCNEQLSSRNNQKIFILHFFGTCYGNEQHTSFREPLIVITFTKYMHRGPCEKHIGILCERQYKKIIFKPANQKLRPVFFFLCKFTYLFPNLQIFPLAVNKDLRSVFPRGLCKDYMKRE